MRLCQQYIDRKRSDATIYCGGLAIGQMRLMRKVTTRVKSSTINTENDYTFIHNFYLDHFVLIIC